MKWTNTWAGASAMNYDGENYGYSLLIDSWMIAASVLLRMAFLWENYTRNRTSLYIIGDYALITYMLVTLWCFRGCTSGSVKLRAAVTCQLIEPVDDHFLKMKMFARLVREVIEPISASSRTINWFWSRTSIVTHLKSSKPRLWTVKPFHQKTTNWRNFTLLATMMHLTNYRLGCALSKSMVRLTQFAARYLPFEISAATKRKLIC